MADVKKKTIVDFRKMKAEGDKITWLTGYDYLTAKYEERAGVEMILVGDSAGNVDVTAAALHAAFSEMGLSLEDMEAVLVHMNA